VQDLDPNIDVGDDERLYRSVRPKLEECYFNPEGQLVLSTEAFNDRQRRVSVYRHDLCESPPHSNPPRLDHDQAVVSATAEEIREKSPYEHKPDGKPASQYDIDVWPDTEDQHRAHCVIMATPDATRGAFEKLKLHLRTVFTTWDICPDPRDTVTKSR
jgi:hypothetical protein